MRVSGTIIKSKAKECRLMDREITMKGSSEIT
jgi:hypothetical protein